MEKKNVVFLTIIAVATLLTALVGATFAYFTATVQTVGETTETVIQTTTLDGVITYTDGTALNTEADPISPGWTGTKGFTITNNGNTDVTYNLEFTEFSNGIDSDGPDGTTNEFVYSVACTASGSESGSVASAAVSETIVPVDGATTQGVLSSIPLKAGATHTCTVTFNFKNLESSAQDYNQGKIFRGTLKASINDIDAE